MAGQKPKELISGRIDHRNLSQAPERLLGVSPGDPEGMLDRARAKAKRLIATAPNRCTLPTAARREIQSILDAADRLAGKRN